MIFKKQKIHSVYLIEAEPFMDDRGTFRRHFCQNEFKTHNISTKVAQANIFENKKKYTLRGIHYQKYPYGEAKTYTCFKGSVYFIVADLRPDSPTYLKWQGFTLKETDRTSLHVPVGCGNASMSLEDNTLVQYYVSQFYTPKTEKGIRYNDPLFKFKWPHKPMIVTKKDKGHPDFVPKKRRS